MPKDRQMNVELRTVMAVLWFCFGDLFQGGANDGIDREAELLHEFL
jgi:hypothetical protein